MTAQQIISQVLENNKGKEDKEIKKALHDAYPGGNLKVWLKEVRVQLKSLKKRKNIL
jgi:hypothetical protein